MLETLGFPGCNIDSHAYVVVQECVLQTLRDERCLHLMPDLGMLS